MKINVINYHDAVLDNDVLIQLVLDYDSMKQIEIRSPDCFLILYVANSVQSHVNLAPFYIVTYACDVVQVELVLYKPVREFFGPGPERSDSVQEQHQSQV